MIKPQTEVMTSSRSSFEA